MWNKYGYTRDTQLSADAIVGPRPTSEHVDFAVTREGHNSLQIPYTTVQPHQYYCVQPHQYYCVQPHQYSNHVLSIAYFLVWLMGLYALVINIHAYFNK